MLTEAAQFEMADLKDRRRNFHGESTPRNSGWSVRTCAVARAIGAPSPASFSQSISRRRPVLGAKRPS